MRRLSILISLVLGIFLSFSSFAADADEIGDTIFSAVPDELAGIVNEDSADRLFDLRYVLSGIADAVGERLFSSFASFGALIAAVVISAVYRTFSGALSPSLAPVLAMLSRVVCSILLFSSFDSMIGDFSSCVSRLCSYMTALSPAVTAICVLGGSVTTAGVMSAGLMLTISLVANVLGAFGTACLRVCFALTLVSALSPKPAAPFLSFMKKTLTWGMGLLLGVFALVMGIQSSLASAADSASMRTVKFALGRLVPIVGGAVSDAVSTVSGSLAFIKSTCGTVAIVVILLTFLPTLVSFISSRIVVSLVSFFASLFGITEEKATLDELGSLVSHMIALLLMTAVMFIYTVTLFASVSFSVGG